MEENLQSDRTGIKGGSQSIALISSSYWSANSTNYMRVSNLESFLDVCPTVWRGDRGLCESRAAPWGIFAQDWIFKSHEP